MGETGADGWMGPTGHMGATGYTGPVGPVGHTGPTGAQGLMGFTGPTGAQGVMGSTGDRGDMGLRGPTGDKGEKGDQGVAGVKGDTGAQGLAGVKGDTGFVGATGPSFSPTFLHADSTVPQALNQEDAVSFDPNAIQYGSIAHQPNTPNIYIWSPGYYHVYFNVYHLEACQFTSFINGVPVPGTTTGSPSGSSQNSTTYILYISPSDVLGSPTVLSPTGFAAKLNLVNHTSFVPVVHLDLAAGSGSASPQITATLTLFRLN
jgi:hypothetical protein